MRIVQLLSRTKPAASNKNHSLVNLSEITKAQRMAVSPQEVPSVTKFVENRYGKMYFLN